MHFYNVQVQASLAEELSTSITPPKMQGRFPIFEIQPIKGKSVTAYRAVRAFFTSARLPKSELASPVNAERSASIRQRITVSAKQCHLSISLICCFHCHLSIPLICCFHYSVNIDQLLFPFIISSFLISPITVTRVGYTRNSGVDKNRNGDLRPPLTRHTEVESLRGYARTITIRDQ